MHVVIGDRWVEEVWRWHGGVGGRRRLVCPPRASPPRGSLARRVRAHLSVAAADGRGVGAAAVAAARAAAGGAVGAARAVRALDGLDGLGGLAVELERLCQRLWLEQRRLRDEHLRGLESGVG